MRKLIGNWKYEINDFGQATIYGRLKSTGKWTPAFRCHSATVTAMIRGGKTLKEMQHLMKPIPIG